MIWISGAKIKLKKVLNFIKEKNGNVQQGDQGVLNAVLSKQTLPISPSYNFATVFTDLSYDQMVKYRKPVNFYSEDEIIEAQQDLHIIHYTSHFLALDLGKKDAQTSI